MIAHVGQKVPFALLTGPTSLVEAPQSTLFPTLPVTQDRPRVHAEVGRYRVRLAESIEDREAACRLRFRVFNIELGEGLQSSYKTGLDTDDFDLFCEHLLVEDKLESNLARRIVGTYRLQSGTTAGDNLGYYSEQEFNLGPYEPLRPGILELGRASIDREHRTPEVLTLLWRGIAQYATDMGLRYLIGCSSLNSKDPAEGWQMYRQLEHYRVSPEFATEPTAAYACPASRGCAITAVGRPAGFLAAFSPQGSQVAQDLSGHRRAHLSLRLPGTASSAPSISSPCSISRCSRRPRAIAFWRRSCNEIQGSPARCGAGIRTVNEHSPFGAHASAWSLDTGAPRTMATIDGEAA